MDKLPSDEFDSSLDEAFVDEAFILRLSHERMSQKISAVTCADTFSCNTATNTKSPVQFPDPVQFRLHQENDSGLQSWIKRHRELKSPFHPMLRSVGETCLWCDKDRILVPTDLTKVVFDRMHHMTHPGFKAGYAMLKGLYWWSWMGKDISKWSKGCISCQLARIHTHGKTPLERLPPPTKQFSHIHVDLVGPMTPCEGKNMLLTIIDQWTSWPEAFPLSATGEAASAQACAKILVREWIPCYGVPDVLTSDRGSQFTSELWASVCKLMGVVHNTTTAYHPQHNGKVERWYRSLKNALRARLLGRHNWIAELPWVMLGL